MNYEETWGNKYKPLFREINALTEIKTFDEDIRVIRKKYTNDTWWDYLPSLKRTELLKKKCIEYMENIGYVEPILRGEWVYALMYGSDYVSYDARIEMYNLITGEYKCKNVHKRDYPMMYCQHGY